MVCQRCRGLLVRETFDGLSPEADMMRLATRCINCGSIEDPVVLANRLRPPAAKRAVPRGMVGMARAVFMKTTRVDLIVDAGAHAPAIHDQVLKWSTSMTSRAAVSHVFRMSNFDQTARRLPAIVANVGAVVVTTHLKPRRNV